MSKKKQPKFAENLTFPYLFQPPVEDLLQRDFEMKGKWGEQFFANKAPITLELGCGKGEYTINLAERNPNINFIGIDLKGARLWRGCRTVREKELKNVGFIRSNIDFIPTLFASNEVDEIWLTFSDPQPQKPRKRLSSTFFIDRYKQLLKPGGKIHLKTDSRLLFNYTLEQIEEHNYNLLNCTFDLYQELDKFPIEFQETLKIRTFYEKMWLEKGYNINYLCFTVN